MMVGTVPHTDPALIAIMIGEYHIWRAEQAGVKSPEVKKPLFLTASLTVSITT